MKSNLSRCNVNRGRQTYIFSDNEIDSFSRHMPVQCKSLQQSNLVEANAIRQKIKHFIQQCKSKHLINIGGCSGNLNDHQTYVVSMQSIMESDIHFSNVIGRGIKHVET